MTKFIYKPWFVAEILWGDSGFQTGAGEGLVIAERWGDAGGHWFVDRAYEQELSVVDDFGDLVPVKTFYK